MRQILLLLAMASAACWSASTTLRGDPRADAAGGDDAPADPPPVGPDGMPFGEVDGQAADTPAVSDADDPRDAGGEDSSQPVDAAPGCTPTAGASVDVGGRVVSVPNQYVMEIPYADGGVPLNCSCGSWDGFTCRCTMPTPIGCLCGGTYNCACIEQAGVCSDADAGVSQLVDCQMVFSAGNQYLVPLVKCQ
jgi:hypothetical protein